MATKTRRQQLQEMLAEEPNDPFLRYGLAMEFVSEGNDPEAVRYLNELLTLAPEYVPGYLQAGQALRRLDRLEEARAVFSRGITKARELNDHHAADEMAAFLADLG
jgi:tetratricopeptide (TPR) repeat protein